MSYKLKCESCQAIGEIDDPVDIFTCPCCNGTMRPLKETTPHELDNVPTMVISREDLKALREAKVAASVGQRPSFGKKTDTASKTFSRPMPTQPQETRQTNISQTASTASRPIFASKAITPRPVQAVRATPVPPPVVQDAVLAVNSDSQETSTIVTPVITTSSIPVEPIEKPVFEPVVKSTQKIEEEKVIEKGVNTPVIETLIQAPVPEIILDEEKTEKMTEKRAEETKVEPVEVSSPVVVEAPKVEEKPFVEPVVAVAVVPPVLPLVISDKKIDVTDEAVENKTVDIKGTVESPKVQVSQIEEKKNETKVEEKPEEKKEKTLIKDDTITHDKDKKIDVKNEAVENKTVDIKGPVESPKVQVSQLEEKKNETKVEEKPEEKKEKTLIKDDTITQDKDKKIIEKKKSVFGKDAKVATPIGAFAKKTPSKKTDVKDEGEKAPTVNEKGQLLKRYKTGKFEIIKDAKGVAVYAPDGVLLNEADTEKYLKVFAEKRKKVTLLLSIATIIGVALICGIIALIMKS